MKKNNLLIVVITAVVTSLITAALFTLSQDPAKEKETAEMASETHSEEPESIVVKEPVSVSEDGAVVVDNQSLIELANDKIAAGYEVVAEINGMVMEHSPEDEIVITEDTITRFDVLVDYSNMRVVLRMKEGYLEESMQ